ncbi:MAG: leucine-rich repeat-containing protein kinase family protein [Oleispira sp.]
MQSLSSISAQNCQSLEPVLRVQISKNLTEFPRHVFEQAESLEILDLSNNQLTDLPDDLDRLLNMRILFLSNNLFTAIPEVLARCPKLEMISFKSNQLVQVAENVLPLATRWLILTDNKIAQLPDSMGKLHRLQKLALAGNRLTDLPASMSACKNLELARLSANDLTEMPDWLFQLPKLAWLAFSGNDFNRFTDNKSAEIDLSVADKKPASVEAVALDDIIIGELIGEGASGFIHRAQWKKQPEALLNTDLDIAVKIFKGSITSDGYPQDELDCCLTAGEHENLIKVLAQLDQSDKDEKLGLVMELISTEYFNLGLPPSLKTCTRDTFHEETRFSIKQVGKIVLAITGTLKHLHEKGISHGDVYAHNTMINDQASTLLGDFGAATNLASLPLMQRDAMAKIEVRALGCLLEDVLTQVDIEAADIHQQHNLKQISELAVNCMQPDLNKRPSFIELQQSLELLISDSEGALRESFTV